VSETVVCPLCGTENVHRASMCAWCETSLADARRGGKASRTVARQPRRDLVADTRRFNDEMPYGATDPVDRWLSAIGNVLVISTLICILVACPIAVAILLNKQQAVDTAGAYYSGSPARSSSEFPSYGALSIIPSLTFALAIYLLFRWVTRLPGEDDW
jgi:hypothetical protein